MKLIELYHTANLLSAILLTADSLTIRDPYVGVAGWDGAERANALGRDGVRQEEGQVCLALGVLGGWLAVPSRTQGCQ